ncbi:MAG TPA: hypothetical protein EYG85_11930 [Crocinitomix sp.]|nr:hypothetical protein [Crocinitomix sp.]
MRQKSGFALAMSLWISAILMAVTIYILSIYKKSVNNGIDLAHKLEAQLLNDSIIEKMKFYAKTGRFEKNYLLNEMKDMPKKIWLDGNTYNLDKNNSISLKGTGALQSLYSGESKILMRKINFILKDNINRKAGFLDWIDIDHEIRFNGGEDSYYRMMEKNYTPSNMGSLQHPSELFLIKGFQDINSSNQKLVMDGFHSIPDSSLNIYDVKLEEINYFMDVPSFEYEQLKALYKRDYSQYIVQLEQLFRKNGYAEIFRSPSFNIIGVVTTQYKESVVKSTIEISFKGLYKIPYTVYRQHLEN